MQTGIVGETAPELDVAYWIDPEGTERAPLKLGELGRGHKILYYFQHWCPGCHSHGFPTLKMLSDRLPEDRFGFAVIQTVFEGEDSNTPDRLREAQVRYGLDLSFGHDVSQTGKGVSKVMEDYRTGGTPWFVIINPEDQIVYNDFHLDADRFIAGIERTANPGSE